MYVYLKVSSFVFLVLCVLALLLPPNAFVLAPIALVLARLFLELVLVKSAFLLISLEFLVSLFELVLVKSLGLSNTWLVTSSNVSPLFLKANKIIKLVKR